MSKFKAGDRVKIIGSYATGKNEPFGDPRRNTIVGQFVSLKEKDGDFWGVAGTPLAENWVWEERELMPLDIIPKELFDID
jgi:hypothetical protein